MGNKGLKQVQDSSVEMTVNKFDSILCCCPKILGYKTHPKITTDFIELHVSSKLSLKKCCALFKAKKYGSFTLFSSLRINCFRLFLSALFLF